jgi:diaminohydroxyphosphoribosylaminopyrimidine deaminase/5-amino-6-(5-phosphoribosylamino)uracil reductase
MSLRAALKELAKRGISSVLIEGGGQTHGEAFKGKLVDEARFFIAPVIQGGDVRTVSGRSAPVPLNDVTCRRIGQDVMISGKVR